MVSRNVLSLTNDGWKSKNRQKEPVIRSARSRRSNRRLGKSSLFAARKSTSSCEPPLMTSFGPSSLGLGPPVTSLAGALIVSFGPNGGVKEQLKSYRDRDEHDSPQHRPLRATNVEVYVAASDSPRFLVSVFIVRQTRVMCHIAIRSTSSSVIS
jgi:hypothetical protein